MSTKEEKDQQRQKIEKVMDQTFDLFEASKLTIGESLFVLETMKNGIIAVTPKTEVINGDH